MNQYDNLPKQEETARYLAERQTVDNATAVLSSGIGPFQPTPKEAWESTRLTILEMQDDFLHAEQVAWLAERGLRYPNLARIFPSLIQDDKFHLQPSNLILGIEKRLNRLRLEWQKRKHRQ